MKCHILFSGKNKKNISKCRLLKILPRVLSVKRSSVGWSTCRSERHWDNKYIINVNLYLSVSPSVSLTLSLSLT